MPVPPQTPYPKTAVARHSDSANSIFLRGANVQNDYDAVAIAVRRFRPTANVVIRTFKETVHEKSGKVWRLFIRVAVRPPVGKIDVTYYALRDHLSDATDSQRD